MTALQQSSREGGAGRAAPVGPAWAVDRVGGAGGGNRSPTMSSFDAPDMPSGQDAAAAAEVQQFLAEEQQRAAMLGVVSKLTVTCWDTCVSKPGSKLSSWESDCISNCARRFIDASVFILNRAAKQQGRQ